MDPIEDPATMEEDLDCLDFEPPLRRRRQESNKFLLDDNDSVSMPPIHPCYNGTLIKENSWFKQYVTQSDPRADSEKTIGLVVDFFICEGYRETVEMLCAESTAEFTETEKQCLNKRYEIRTSIVNGEIAKAITQIQDYVPSLLADNPKVHFQLLRQQLVELIREKRVTEALDFAQTYLKGLTNQPSELLQKLEQTYGLLVFEKPETSPFGYLLDHNQRNILAAEVNSLICGIKGKNPTSKLEQLFRLIFWNKQQVSSRGEAISERDDDHAAQIAKALFCPDDDLHRGIANF
uniref:LisH domain-containing protein n=1 Tax=Panagrellus redivivus TaxID=6233 RepID=A0A7E4VTM6_PANRE